MSDTLADMITRIRNGQKANKVSIKAIYSKLNANVCSVLKNEGYINGFNVDKNENKQVLVIDLKYNSGSPVISVIERVSKPGRRVFSSAQSLPKINNGLGIAIISTPKGVMTDIDARKQKVGGEIICKVF